MARFQSTKTTLSFSHHLCLCCKPKCKSYFRRLLSCTGSKFVQQLNACRGTASFYAMSSAPEHQSEDPRACCCAAAAQCAQQLPQPPSTQAGRDNPSDSRSSSDDSDSSDRSSGGRKAAAPMDVETAMKIVSEHNQSRNAALALIMTLYLPWSWSQ